MDGPKTKPGTVLVVGPLAPFVPAFESKLTDAGYTPLTAVTQKRLLAHVSRWLAAKGLNVGDLTNARIQEFLDSRRARGCTWLITREGLIPLLELLAQQGVLPAPEVAVVESSVDVLLANFAAICWRNAGWWLRPQTRTCCGRVASLLAVRPPANWTKCALAT